jgi:geranylgeranyl diphosphate synthase type II
MNKKKLCEGFDLIRYMAVKRDIIETALSRYLPKNADNVLVSAMRYSLLANGKRIRPILCLATGDALKASKLEILTPTACALEMIHTYSLIHDDLPAMDDDNLRRGMPTCHNKFGEATAILAGDALLTLAFDLASLPAKWSVDFKCQLSVVNLLARAAGHTGMVEGQSRDLISEGMLLPFEDLKILHQLKTGRIACRKKTVGWSENSAEL